MASDVDGQIARQNSRAENEVAGQKRGVEGEVRASADVPGEVGDARSQAEDRRREAERVARDPGREVESRVESEKRGAVDRAKNEPVAGDMSSKDLEAASDDPKRAVKIEAKKRLDE